MQTIGSKNVTGTLTQDGVAVVTTSGTQTLTNKTLTAPKIATIDEATAAAGVSVDGLNIKDGKLNTNDSVVTTNLTNSSVTLAKIDFSTWPAFFAYRTSALSTINGNTQVTANLTSYNIGSCYNTTTCAFTPSMNGYYRFTGRVSSFAANTRLLIELRKNGTTIIRGTDYGYSSAGESGVVTGSMYLTTTDSITCYLYTPAAISLEVGADILYFCGEMIRPA